MPYDPWWPSLFSAEAERLRAIFVTHLVAIHHIGSTAVPGLSAKPVIDILPVVSDITQVDGLNEALQNLGYSPKGEAGLPGRRFFLKPAEDFRTHHVHCFQTGNPEIERHLAFRDYLISHPDEARTYGQIKETLAQQFPHDIQGYMDGKDAFIKNLENKALVWYTKVI